MAGHDPVKGCAVCGARLGPVNRSIYCHNHHPRNARHAPDAHPVNDMDDMAVNFRRRLLELHGFPDSYTASVSELWKVLGDHAGGRRLGCDACSRSRIGRTSNSNDSRPKKVPDDAC